MVRDTHAAGDRLSCVDRGRTYGVGIYHCMAHEFHSGISCRHEYFPDADVVGIRRLFPGGDSGWLYWLIRGNPLTYGVAGLRRLLYDTTLPVTPELPSMLACVSVTLIATVTLTMLSACLVSRRSVHNAA